MAGPLAFDGFSGSRPMTWGEVYDFHLATERLPFPWERELIRELSAAYFQGMEEGKDPLNIEPYLRTTDG